MSLRPEPLDPLASIRRNPSMFFASGAFEPETMAGLIAAEASTARPHAEVTIRWMGDWCSIESGDDWLDGDPAAFTHLAPFPAGGQNSVRLEAVITAFCDFVVTVGGSVVSEFGTLGTNEIPDVMRINLRRERAGRVVVFRYARGIGRRSHQDQRSDVIEHLEAGLAEREKEFVNAR